MSLQVLSEQFPNTFDALNTAIFPEEYSEYHASIANLALDIYQSLHQQFHSDFPERDAVITWLKEYRSGKMPLPPKLIKHGKIKEHYILAFIESKVSEEAITHDKRIFDSYKPLAFSMVIRLLLMGLREDYREELCLELRMYAINHRPEMSRFLPAIKQQVIDRLKDEIVAVKLNLDKTSQSTYINQLDHYIHPLDLLVSGKNEEIRQRGKNRERLQYRVVSKEEKSIDTDGNTINEVREKLKKSRAISQSQRDEHDTTPDDTKLLLIGLADSTKEPRANDFIAKGFTHRLILRKKKLSTQLDHLTEDICQTLSDYCHNNLSQKGASLLLFVLLTGLSPEELKKVKHVKRKDYAYIHRPHHLPTYIQHEDFLKFIPKVNRSFQLPLPRALANINPQNLYREIDEAKEILSELNKKYKTHVTIERLRLNLRSKLTTMNIDSAITGILCGDELSQVPALSYTSICLTRVFETYKRYVRQNTLSEYAESLIISQKGIIGSNLAIKDQVIVSQLNRIKKAFIQSVDIPEQFYYLAIYTYYIVALFSAYRPVTAMLGYFNDINFITGTYAISDKENRAGISTRIITLPTIALEQIKIYRAFIEEIINKYHCIYPVLANRCRDALNESHQSPWLFFPMDNKIIEANPDELVFRLRPFFPMADNWHRHWARTKLLFFDLPRDIVDGWIGHADLEEESFGRFSGLSLKDMKTVSEKFDSWAFENKVTIIDG